jgi:diamine N-acetyltransferase
MIKGEHIILRALELNDADLLYEWENDMEIWHLSNTITPFSRFTLEQYVLNAHQDIFTSKQLRLMIVLKDSLITIGSIDIFEFDPMHRRAGLGILILKEYRGKGLASEALDLVISYAFSVLNLHQLFCNIGKSNTESLNLFSRKNFSIIGTKKEWVWDRNKWEDEIMLQYIRENER